MSLPCSTCRAECCGPVPLTASVLEKIAVQVEAMGEVERERLASQKRGVFDCGLLDMETRRCSVYSARPAVCRLFGKVEEMPCPHGVDKLYHPLDVPVIIGDETLRNMVMFSTDFDFRSVSTPSETNKQ